MEANGAATGVQVVSVLTLFYAGLFVVTAIGLSLFSHRPVFSVWYRMLSHSQFWMAAGIGVAGLLAARRLKQ